MCTTDAKGEQHCSVQTAWWGSASATNATRTNATAATQQRPRLRGLAPARVEDRGEAGGVRVEAGGPATDSATGGFGGGGVVVVVYMYIHGEADTQQIHHALT